MGHCDTDFLCHLRYYAFQNYMKLYVELNQISNMCLGYNQQVPDEFSGMTPEGDAVIAIFSAIFLIVSLKTVSIVMSIIKPDFICVFRI